MISKPHTYHTRSHYLTCDFIVTLRINWMSARKARALMIEWMGPRSLAQHSNIPQVINTNTIRLCRLHHNRIACNWSEGARARVIFGVIETRNRQKQFNTSTERARKWTHAKLFASEKSLCQSQARDARTRRREPRVQSLRRGIRLLVVGRCVPGWLLRVAHFVRGHGNAQFGEHVRRRRRRRRRTTGGAGGPARVCRNRIWIG